MGAPEGGPPVLLLLGSVNSEDSLVMCGNTASRKDLHACTLKGNVLHSNSFGGLLIHCFVHADVSIACDSDPLVLGSIAFFCTCNRVRGPGLAHSKCLKASALHETKPTKEGPANLQASGYDLSALMHLLQ